MNENNTNPGETANREIVISRLLNAPRELVFEVWTNPAHVAKWWGPNGFTNTIHQMDVRPGGEWNFTMHGPDGTDYRNEIRFIEIKKPELLVYFHGPTPKFNVRVTFEDQGGKTNLTMRSVFESVEELERVVKVFNAIEGGKQHLSRLEEYLAKNKGAQS